jgi:hypothetical protein
MKDDRFEKIFRLLDVISIEVAAGRNELRSETADIRKEMRAGFGRVERRLGNLETRVEGVESEMRSFRGEFDRRLTALER